jgi:UDP-N-acetylmuramoyl-L-alanyl-D-glutamate--2,6-diaminopimelate ligase
LTHLLNLPRGISGITADSRAVQPGFLFAALPGVKNDGRDFIAAAIANGATHILAPRGTTAHDAHVIESDNPRADFARMAAKFYHAQPDVIVAVTGTNGKTSTVNILRQLWEKLEYKSAAIGTLGVMGTHFVQGGALTTPDPVKLHETFAALKQIGINHAAIEASSHGIDQERLAGTRLTGGIFTNLTRDHLDYHGTMENYFAAKARLFTELLPDGAPAAINADDDYGKKLIAQCNSRLRVCSFGKHGRDLKLIKTTARPDGFEVTVQYDWETHDFYLPLLGSFQIWNVLGALGVMLYSGTKMPDLLAAIQTLSPVRGRLELVGRTQSGAPIFVDYAHTPDALETVLCAVRKHAEGQLTVVFGCGGDRDKGKRPEMGKIAITHAERSIVTDDNPRTENAATIRAEVMAGTEGKAREIGDRRGAIQTAISELTKGDILIIAGKGHEQGQIIGTETIPFDDASVVRDILKASVV